MTTTETKIIKELKEIEERNLWPGKKELISDSCKVLFENVKSVLSSQFIMLEKDVEVKGDSLETIQTYVCRILANSPETTGDVLYSIQAFINTVLYKGYDFKLYSGGYEIEKTLLENPNIDITHLQLLLNKITKTDVYQVSYFYPDESPTYMRDALILSFAKNPALPMFILEDAGFWNSLQSFLGFEQFSTLLWIFQSSEEGRKILGRRIREYILEKNLHHPKYRKENPVYKGRKLLYRVFEHENGFFSVAIQLHSEFKAIKQKYAYAWTLSLDRMVSFLTEKGFKGDVEVVQILDYQYPIALSLEKDLFYIDSSPTSKIANPIITVKG